MAVGSATNTSIVNALGQVRLGTVVTIIAPTGYGKTTLLGAWRNEADLRTVLVSLHHGIDSPGAFVRLLVGELGSLVPPDLVPTQWPDDAPEWESHIAAALLKALQPTYLVLMIDNVRHARHPGVQAIIRQFVLRTPPRMIFALSGRWRPTVGLMRAQAQGVVTSVTASDLQLTPENLAKIPGRRLSPKRIEALLERTNGWPAALPMALAELTGAADVDEQRDALRTLIIDAVLEPMDPALRAFLADAAELSPAGIDLLDAARGGRDSAAFMEMLLQEPPPLVTVTEGVIEVHPLMRDAMGVLPHPRRTVLLSRAADHYTRMGDDARAHALLVDSGERGALLDYLEGLGRSSVVLGDPALVRRWLNALSPDELAARPPLQAMLVLLDLGDGNSASAAAWARRVSDPTSGWRDLDHGPPGRILADVMGVDLGPREHHESTGWWGVLGLLLKANQAVRAGNFTEAERQLNGLAPLTGTIPLADSWRAHLLTYLLVRLNRDDEARQCLQQAQARLAASHEWPTVTSFLLDIDAGLLAARAGHHKTARRALDAALPTWTRFAAEVPLRALMPQVVLAETALLLGDKARATEILAAVSPAEASQGLDIFIDEHARLMAMAREDSETSEHGLSLLQLRILRALCSHKTVPAIAAEMDRAPATIRAHVQSVYATLGVHSRADAIIRADELGLLDGQVTR